MCETHCEGCKIHQPSAFLSPEQYFNTLPNVTHRKKPWVNLYTINKLIKARNRIKPIKINNQKTQITYTSQAGRLIQKKESLQTLKEKIAEGFSEQRKNEATEGNSQHKIKLKNKKLLDEYIHPSIKNLNTEEKQTIRNIVYLALHLPTGKKYIGRTNGNLLNRICEHYYGRCNEQASGLSYYFLLHPNLEEYLFTPVAVINDATEREKVEIGYIKLMRADINIHLYNGNVTKRSASHRPRWRHKENDTKEAITINHLKEALRIGQNYKNADNSATQQFYVRTPMSHPIMEKKFLKEY